MKDYKQNFYFSIKEIYNSFRKKLEESIKKNVISLSNFECYLINDTWEKELKNNIDRIESIIIKFPKKRNTIDKNSIYPLKRLVFVNDISIAIDSLNNKNYLRLIKKELMIKLFGIKFLSINNTVNYFCGNNLLIIEFRKANRYGYDISSLLITNPFDIDKDNNSSLFISIKIKEEDKLEIYKRLLSSEILLNLHKNKIDNGNNFINFDEILSLKNIDSFYNEIKSLNPNEIIKKNILKIFFYIYYFEEYLATNGLSEIFNIYHNLNYNLNYNLINSNWINKFKKAYNYKKIHEYLQEYNNSNKAVNYNNLDGNIKIIFNSYLNKNPNSIKIEFPENLKNIEEMKPSIIEYEELSFFGKNYIISEKILEMIKKYVFKNKSLSVRLNKIFSINDSIFLVDNSKLIIGNLNDELLFIPKYVLNYKNI